MANLIRGMLALVVFLAIGTSQALACGDTCDESQCGPKKSGVALPGSNSPAAAEAVSESPEAATEPAVETKEADEVSTSRHNHEIKLQIEDKDGKITKIVKKSHHKVACVHPNAACPESEKVIETLKTLASFYTEGNFDELSKFMDEGVTTFDEGSKKLIIGKDAVMADIKRRWTLAHDEGRPVLSYTINHPYAKVTGDRAVVTFDAVKQVGGKKPEAYMSHCTDIFVKKDDGWKKLHYRSSWKKTNKEGS